MRLYGRNFLKKNTDKRVSKRVESRDAILMSVDTANNVCRVRIQGSETLIVAHFPKNLTDVPSWLRLGNAVRIAHRAGNRGYIEVTGPGRAIPSGTRPAIGSLQDMILTGMIVTASDPAGLGVFLTDGTYRLGGDLLVFDSPTGGFYVMDTDPLVFDVIPVAVIGQITWTLGAAPSAGYFRYDIIVVDVSGDLSTVEGAAVTSDPLMPSVPANHLLVQSVLRVGGETTIPNNRIGMLWTTPIPITLTLTYDDEMSWSEVEENFVVGIEDQYGNSISSSDGWVAKLTFLMGTGWVWSANTGYDTSEAQQDLVGVSSYTFKYKRDQSASPEIPPYLQASLEASPTIYNYGRISLLDVGGDPI